MAAVASTASIHICRRQGAQSALLLWLMLQLPFRIQTECSKTTTIFKVEDFVLPRFEVTLRPPPYSLATDSAFSFTVCANYTFGQPVKGNLSITFDNTKSRKCQKRITRNITISGCTDVEETAAKLQIVDCNVYSLKVNAVVTEEGTGVEAMASTTTSIQRRLITLKTLYKDQYMKPNLPFTLKVRASRPDNTAGVGVPVELCAGGQCTNLTTGVDGLITAVLPNYQSVSVRMKALNSRVNMYSSEYYQTLSHYFSPSNSSLLIYAPEETLKCAEAGQSTSQHILPVLFSARDQPTAAITVQVVSRGSIQYTNTQDYQLPSGPLPISTEHLVEPLPPPLPGTVRGVINLTISLPDTASPIVKVLIWYTRADGEVVSDNRELKVEKCLPHQVNLQWSTPNTQPGQPATLTLTSLPEAVCSLGVVDKSSELLAVDPDPINLDSLFSFINTFKIDRYTNRQVNDQSYCTAKLRPADQPSSSGFLSVLSRYNYYSDYVDALKMFDNAGVYAFTDDTIETRPCERDGYGGVSAAVDQASQPRCGDGQTPPPQRRDALIKSIKVEAEGFLRENSWSKYICSKDFETGEDSLETWQLTLPSVLVEGSARGWVTAVGDLLALTLENLGNLIRMPYGCGEQNMINFAPNIFILRYLDTTKQNTPQTRTKLLTFMKTGYRRELLYRRHDGSYSAFGNVDDSGSTWLTAFVLKSFQQARQYIQVDTDQLKETTDWLLRLQGTQDGCFESVGKLINKQMQGGINSGNEVSLTAYVMAALLEAETPKDDPIVSRAALCLTNDTSTHPYALATKAYALALASHPNATSLLQKLLSQAAVTKNAMYWNLPKDNSRAVSLETAGYAILALMTHDPKTNEEKARKIVKWITAQRNGQGGFYSTQDTVVALQALATYEGHLHQETLNVKAVVTANNFTHTFTITDNNKLLEQYQSLPTLPTTVSINMTGQGCVVLQAVQRYNIPEPEPSDAFTLTVNTITTPDKQCTTKRITACAAYRLPDQKSNMAVIEVDLISGYIPEKQDLKQMLKLDPNIKRYEVDGSKIHFYMDELLVEDTCVNFRVIRQVDVEDVKPGTVIVYDYYQPEFSISKRYTLPPPEECR
ncbi:hypothetical protein Pmani_024447 [Petrolisthes manimaculis]|uniref:Alpha-2-macroglobulin n=2 Tax=Petrolisthes manimaculis TaxID=1843537 RepID=A0AAE1U274_9EUCA|nr:hypothetical protein Pmani_024447 [Petrolisthes manimaculis]